MDDVLEISSETARLAWHEVGGYSAAKLAEEAERLMARQGPLFAFVLDATADLSDDAHQLALYMALVVYRMYERTYSVDLAEADAHEVLDALQRHQSWIEEVANAHDRILHERILPNLKIRQPRVMEYVGDCVFDSEEELELDEGDQGQLFLVMQTFVDVLDRCSTRMKAEPTGPDRPRVRRGKKASPVYQLKVTLKGIRPPIWRRIQVPGNLRLSKLHRILQVAMGWQDMHLHLFTAGGVEIGEPDPEWEHYGERIADECKVELRAVAPEERSRFTYRYDLGDGWEHSVLVEKVLPPGSATGLPRCLDGRRACPPEDSGGIPGYQRLRDALADPGDPAHESMRQWIGGSWNPESFDLEEVNARLSRIR